MCRPSSDAVPGHPRDDPEYLQTYRIRVLFKKFANIDVFDIEINELNPEKLVEIIAALEPAFGGINLEDIKARYAKKTSARKLPEVIGGADIFLGLSAGGVLKQDMVKRMADRPIILALANPTAEITPEEVMAVRDDAIIATGRPAPPWLTCSERYDLR